MDQPTLPPSLDLEFQFDRTLDADWLARLHAVEPGTIDDARIQELNNLLTDEDTTTDAVLFEIGVFKVDETPLEQKLKKRGHASELLSRVPILKLLRALDSSGVDVTGILTAWRLMFWRSR
jgi:hypothetical protein